jgi:hypothetical protein
MFSEGSVDDKKDYKRYNVGQYPNNTANYYNEIPTKSYIYTPPIRPIVKPPRASFFGRLDKQRVNIVGNFEEKYVPDYEMWEWKRQKERKEALAAGIVDEKPKKEYTYVYNKAKPEKMDELPE